MSGTDVSPTAGPTDWLAGAYHGVREEVRLFATTVVAVSISPRRFAGEWRERRRRTLNPLAFLGTALAVSSPPTLLVSHLAGLQEDGGSLWDAFLSDQVAPYLQYLLLGILAHGFLRLLGGKQKLLATVGIALYAGGGPAMLVDLLTLPLDVVLGRLAASAGSAALQGLTVASIAAANVAFLVTFALGLAGLHRVRVWRPAVALLAAYVVLMVLRVAFFELLAS